MLNAPDSCAASNFFAGRLAIQVGLEVGYRRLHSRKRLKVLVATLSTPRMVTYSRKAHRDEQNDESEPYPPCCGHVDRVSASHAALCTARHGVRSHPVPVALVGDCSIPVRLEGLAPGQARSIRLLQKALPISAHLEPIRDFPHCP